jgi:hypothetical protein
MDLTWLEVAGPKLGILLSCATQQAAKPSMSMCTL